MTRRIVVAITGATGAIYGIRLLEELKKVPVETHLVISSWGMKTISMETSYKPADVLALADRTYRPENQAAAISSGSYLTSGMIIAPCSMKTLSALASGYSDGLVARAGDVALKEGRRLVVMVREAPVTSIHLENMLRLSRAGAIVFPPAPAFYAGLTSLCDMINHTVGRVLDQFEIQHDLVNRWMDRGPS